VKSHRAGTTAVAATAASGDNDCSKQRQRLQQAVTATAAMNNSKKNATIN